MSRDKLHVVKEGEASKKSSWIIKILLWCAIATALVASYLKYKPSVSKLSDLYKEKEEAPRIIKYKSSEWIPYWIYARFKKSDLEKVEIIQQSYRKESLIPEESQDKELSPNTELIIPANFKSIVTPYFSVFPKAKKIFWEDIQNPQILNRKGLTEAPYFLTVQKKPALFFESNHVQENRLHEYKTPVLKDSLQLPLTLETFVASEQDYFNQFGRLFEKHRNFKDRKIFTKKMNHLERQWSQASLKTIQALNPQIPLKHVFEKKLGKIFQLPEFKDLNNFIYRSQARLAVHLELFLKNYFQYDESAFAVKSLQRKQNSKILLEKIKKRQGSCLPVNIIYQIIAREYFNLPTRLVTGFLSPRKRGPQGFYGINLETQGHAWTEVLIGEKWFLMDATPTKI